MSAAIGGGRCTREPPLIAALMVGLADRQFFYHTNTTVYFSVTPVNLDMNLHDLMRELRDDNGSKIVLVVADGLGGLPLELGEKTELETARTPNLDAMVREGVCGLSIPVLPGIAPGSGPG